MSVTGEQRGRSGDRLSRLQRIAFGVLGLIITTAGGISVYTRDNGAGSTALIVAGTALGLIGALGRTPSRIAGGGVEVEFPPAVQTVSSLLASPDPSVRAATSQAYPRTVAERGFLALSPTEQALYELVLRKTRAFNHAREIRVSAQISSAVTKAGCDNGLVACDYHVGTSKAVGGLTLRHQGTGRWIVVRIRAEAPESVENGTDEEFGPTARDAARVFIYQPIDESLAATTTVRAEGSG